MGWTGPRTHTGPRSVSLHRVTPSQPKQAPPPLRPAQGCSVRRLRLAPSGTAVWERDYGVSDVKFSCQSFQHVV